MFIPQITTVALAAAVACLPRTVAVPAPQPTRYSLVTVHQFPNNSWLENMAVRANGHILATDLDKGLIYDIDPANDTAVPSVIARLPQGSVPAGIAEVEDDVFYVNNGLGVASNLTFYPNTSSVWKVDMRSSSSTGQASVAKLIDIPEATILNGVVTASKTNGVIFLGDPVAGLIYELDVFKPSYKVVLDHPLLKPNYTSPSPFGVNGLRIRNSKLYFSNTNYGYLGTFPLSSTGASQPKPELITSAVPTADDFAVDRRGFVWLTENGRQTLVRVSPAGQIAVVAGEENSTALLGPVSATFGRQTSDQDTLYISTDGLSFDAKGKPLTTAGKIAKIDTRAKMWRNGIN